MGCLGFASLLAAKLILIGIGLNWWRADQVYEHVLVQCMEPLEYYRNLWSDHEYFQGPNGTERLEQRLAVLQHHYGWEEEETLGDCAEDFILLSRGSMFQDHYHHHPIVRAFRRTPLEGTAQLLVHWLNYFGDTLGLLALLMALTGRCGKMACLAGVLFLLATIVDVTFYGPRLFLNFEHYRLSLLDCVRLAFDPVATIVSFALCKALCDEKRAKECSAPLRLEPRNEHKAASVTTLTVAPRAQPPPPPQNAKPQQHFHQQQYNTAQHYAAPVAQPYAYQQGFPAPAQVQYGAYGGGVGRYGVAVASAQPMFMVPGAPVYHM